MQQGLYWLFIDSKTRVVSRRLSQSAAEDFLSNLRNVNIDHWWAWNPFFRDWIPLRNIVDVKESKIRMLIHLPHGTAGTDDKPVDWDKTQTKIPEEYTEVRDYLREEVVEEVKDFRDFHGDDLTFSRPPQPPTLGFGADRRRAARVNKKIEVIIASRGKSFRTQTVNISVTGLMLEKAIPFDMKGGPFEIVFIVQDAKGKKQFAFQGKVSGDLEDRRRLVFSDLPSKTKKILDEILAA
jgi:c-di-GMP-binding flagellar brake protein YcgR